MALHQAFVFFFFFYIPVQTLFRRFCLCSGTITKRERQDYFINRVAEICIVSPSFSFVGCDLIASLNVIDETPKPFSYTSALGLSLSLFNEPSPESDG